MLSVQRPTFNQTTLSSLRSIRYALREQPIDSISSARRASSILLRRANRVIVKFEGAARLRWVRRHGRLESHFSLHRGDFAVAGFGARLASWRSLSRLAHRRSHRSGERMATTEGAARLRRVRRHRRLWDAPAVLVLIFLNIAVFLFEISFGDWTDPGILRQLGALDPYAVVVQGEYWRLFTALFLHAGFAHLFFNLFALYVLGPPLERSIGALRFAACYLISGFGSSAGVVLLTMIGFVHAAQLVGASGCVMGIAGAWAGFLLRHQHVPHARQRLTNIAMIVVIQVAFDLSTPQVSMAAHLCGLIAGFFAGLAIAPKKMSLKSPARFVQ